MVEDAIQQPTPQAAPLASPPETPLETARPASSNNSNTPLAKLLIERGLVTEDQIQVALHERKGVGGEATMLGTILVQMGFVTESALSEVLAESSGVKSVDLKSSILDPKLIQVVPKEVALRSKALPLMVQDETILVAMSDVYNIIALDQVRKYFDKRYKIQPVYAPESQILEIIDQYYDYEMSIDGILKEIEAGIADKKTVSGEGNGYVYPTVRLVDAFLIDGIKAGASDIHFEPEGSFVRLRYRIDGKLRQIRSFHKEYWQAIAVRIKILSGMNIAESRHPQDGRIGYNVLGREVDFRVASQPTVHGENIVMRILDKKQSLTSMDKLGFSQHNSNVLTKMIKRPEGIVIVTGPTGSGKTTTLYSILNYINSTEKNIMTLEDPVEYQLPLIRQSSIRESSGMTFSDGVRSLMRQDPDIIFVGEIRDSDTATMALRAAMTGHQVYTTLHTNDAAGAIPRLLDIGVERGLLAGSLIGIMSQRLIRCLCIKCREAYTPNEEECRILGLPKENSPQIYRHKGCEACYFIGYKGRSVVGEVLLVDKGMDELIATGATRRTMLDHAIKNGFVSIIDDGIQKVVSGITDLEALIDTLDMTERL
jgi:type IV pilus assembly protein PilB